MNPTMFAIIVLVLVTSLLRSLEDVRAVHHEERTIAMEKSTQFEVGYVPLKKCDALGPQEERLCVASGKERQERHVEVAR